MIAVSRVALVVVLVALVPSARADMTDQIWAEILRSRVNAFGEVAYRSLVRHDGPLLKRVLHDLAEVDATRLDRDAAVAFWLNAYHAVVLLAVVQGERPEMVAGRARMYHWFRQKLAGKPRTLDDVRAILDGYAAVDARIHLAVWNGTRGGPPLATEPYRHDRLDAQLTQATRRFVNDAQRTRTDTTGRVELSRLFLWYRADFERATGSVAGFMRAYVSPSRPALRAALQGTKVTVRYLPFDWRLAAAPDETPL